MNRPLLVLGVLAVLVAGAAFLVTKANELEGCSHVTMEVSTLTIPPDAWFNMSEDLLQRLPASSAAVLARAFAEGHALERVPETDWQETVQVLNQADVEESGGISRTFDYDGEFYVYSAEIC